MSVSDMCGNGKVKCGTCMYNKCLRKLYSKLWKQATLRWFPKKSGGFRPISLLSTLKKLLNTVVNMMLTDTKEKRE